MAKKRFTYCFIRNRSELHCNQTRENLFITDIKLKCVWLHNFANIILTCQGIFTVSRKKKTFC